VRNTAITTVLPHPERDTTGRRHRPRRLGRATRRARATVTAAVLLSAIALPNVAVHHDGGSIAIRHVAACAPIGPIASRHVDKKKLCRRARKKAMRSLKTGRDPDWGDVIRDSIPKASHRPRRHPASKHRRHKAKKHSSTPTLKTSTSPSPDGRTGPAERTPDPPSEGQPLVRSATAKTPENGHDLAPMPPAGPDSRGFDMAMWVGMATLLIMIVGGVYASLRYKLFVKTALSMLRSLKRHRRPGTQATSATLTSPGASHADLFTGANSKLTGPGAEDAVRRYVVDALVDRHGEAVEFVLSRQDAWRLFGIENGTLRDERILGLTLTEDRQQARAYLARRGLVRRIFITCGGETEDVHEVRVHKPDLAVISLSRLPEGATKIAANGEVNPVVMGPPMPRSLPLLPRHDALDRLTSMPTIARQPNRP
jgi:hypothetical protein